MIDWFFDLYMFLPYQQDGYLSIKTSDKLTEFHQSFGISIRIMLGDLIRVGTHPHALHQLHLLLRDHKIRRSLRAPISMSDVLSTTNPPRNRFTSTLGESLVYDKEEARELFV